MPRFSAPRSQQNANSNWPSSPKYVNNYGLNFPALDRQVLIDQIITNCEKAESPLSHRSNHNSYQSSKNSSLKNELNEEKQNKKYIGSPTHHQRILLNKNQNGQQILSHRTRPTSQYFTSNYAQHQREKQSVIHLGPSQRHSEYYHRPNSKQKHLQKHENLNNEKQNEEQQYARFKKRIDQQRVNHIQHCKRQQRKLRLYYVQLENKICEMRNRQLRMLAEFQSNKLAEFENCSKTLTNRQASGIHESKRKFDEVLKWPILRVNEQIKPETKGCLISGVSGIYFSFDQRKI